MRSRARRALCLCLVGCLAVAGGCALWRNEKRPPPLENPISVPFTNCDDLWNVIVDVVDDDFDIATEQRVRQAGDVLTVGRIDTAPQVGATLLEPRRGDAADKYQRLHGTLQSLRRRAVIQVIPAGDTFQIEALVYKELEDLSRPEFSTAGSATFRNDGSLVRVEEATGVLQPTLGWIPLGRDMIMEQKLLAKIIAHTGATRTQFNNGSTPFGISPEQYLPPGAAVPSNSSPYSETLQKPPSETLPSFDGGRVLESVPPGSTSPSGPTLSPGPNLQPVPF